MMSKPISELLEIAKEAAIDAGKEILEIYEKGDFKAFEKDDDSPVTTADYRSNEIIMAKLTSLTPKIPIMSEEVPLAALEERSEWTRYWLIDPIDGTQEFIARSGDFAVNIALIENNKPAIGVIYWPCADTLYFASLGQGAYKQRKEKTESIEVRRFGEPCEDEIMIAISRRQKTERVLKRMSDKRKYQTLATGSCSLKACLIAEGRADVYMRLGVTGEWDTGASECIINEAGGAIKGVDFSPMSYNQREIVTNPDFIVMGDQRVDWQEVICYK